MLGFDPREVDEKSVKDQSGIFFKHLPGRHVQQSYGGEGGGVRNKTDEEIEKLRDLDKQGKLVHGGSYPTKEQMDMIENVEE